MGRYTLKIYDIKNKIIHKLKLYEQGYCKEKVRLTTIDKFILNHKTNTGEMENFNNQEELRQYYNQTFNQKLSEELDVYISYQANNEEKKLEVIYDNNNVIKYFTHLYTYLYQNNSKEKKVVKEVKKDEIWNLFVSLFEELIMSEFYYNFIMYGEGKTYINYRLKKFLENYYYAKYDSSYDGRETFYEAKKEIEKQLLSYKVLRGIQLSFDKFNQIYNSNVGIKSDILRKHLQLQQHNMLINEPIYKRGEEETQRQKYYTGNEEIDQFIGNKEYTVSEFSELIFEELGLTLDDLENYPELQEQLGIFPGEKTLTKKID